jgi:hypothetical protein
VVAQPSTPATTLAPRKFGDLHRTELLLLVVSRLRERIAHGESLQQAEEYGLHDAVRHVEE